MSKKIKFENDFRAAVGWLAGTIAVCKDDPEALDDMYEDLMAGTQKYGIGNGVSPEMTIAVLAHAIALSGDTMRVPAGVTVGKDTDATRTSAAIGQTFCKLIDEILLPA